MSLFKSCYNRIHSSKPVNKIIPRMAGNASVSKTRERFRDEGRTKRRLRRTLGFAEHRGIQPTEDIEEPVQLPKTVETAKDKLLAWKREKEKRKAEALAQRPPFNRFVRPKHTGTSPFTLLSENKSRICGSSGHKFNFRKDGPQLATGKEIAKTVLIEPKRVLRARPVRATAAVTKTRQADIPVSSAIKPLSCQRVPQKLSTKRTQKVLGNENVQAKPTLKNAQAEHTSEVRPCLKNSQAEPTPELAQMQTAPTQLKQEAEAEEANRGCPRPFIFSPMVETERGTNRLSFKRTPERGQRINLRDHHCKEEVDEASNGLLFQRSRLERERVRLDQLASSWEVAKGEGRFPEWAEGEVDALVGQTRLLATDRTGKFHQFDMLIASASNGALTLSDLDGFWDLLQLQVEKLDKGFERLKKSKETGWTVSGPVDPVVEPPVRKRENFLRGRKSKGLITAKASKIRQHIAALRQESNNVNKREPDIEILTATPRTPQPLPGDFPSGRRLTRSSVAALQQHNRKAKKSEPKMGTLTPNPPRSPLILPVSFQSERRLTRSSFAVLLKLQSDAGSVTAETPIGAKRSVHPSSTRLRRSSKKDKENQPHETEIMVSPSVACVKKPIGRKSIKNKENDPPEIEPTESSFGATAKTPTEPKRLSLMAKMNSERAERTRSSFGLLAPTVSMLGKNIVPPFVQPQMGLTPSSLPRGILRAELTPVRSAPLLMATPSTTPRRRVNFNLSPHSEDSSVYQSPLSSL